MWISVVNRGAAFELKTLQFTTPDGKVNINGHVALPKKEGAAPNIFTLFQSFSAGVDITLPVSFAEKVMSQYNTTQLLKSEVQKQLVAKQKQAAVSQKTVAEIQKMRQQQTSAQINKWLESGTITQEGNFSRFKASYDNGNLKLNGIAAKGLVT